MSSTPSSLAGLGLGSHSGSKATKWVKIGSGIVALAFVYSTSPTLGALLVTVIVGGLIVLDCVKHPLHIIRYVGALILLVALLPNVAAGPTLLDVGGAFGRAGDRAAPVVQGWLPAAKGNVFNPTTTMAPPPAGADPALVSAPTTTTPPAAPTPGPLPAAAPLPVAPTPVPGR